MTMVRVNEALVQQVGARLVNGIIRQFPDVEVRFATRNQLSRERALAAQGFPDASAGFRGCVLVLAPTRLHEDIEWFATNLASDLWEETGVVIGMRVSNRVWCRESGPPSSAPVSETGDLPVTSILRPVAVRDGLEFWCRNPHVMHKWEKLQP